MLPAALSATGSMISEIAALKDNQKDDVNDKPQRQLQVDRLSARNQAKQPITSAA
jgi:hypothetical protein